MPDMMIGIHDMFGEAFLAVVFGDTFISKRKDSIGLESLMYTNEEIYPLSIECQVMLSSNQFLCIFSSYWS
jgi:hypothetical protein